MGLRTTLALILTAILSFTLFLFYRIKYSGSTATAVKQAWTAAHYCAGMGFLWVRLPLWLKGNFKDITLLFVIIPYTVTGFTMFYLSLKDICEKPATGG